MTEGHRREIRGSSYVCADCGEDLGSLRKVADKFNDYLMNPKARPDLQTPEAQSFLQTLQQEYLSPTTDAMMPWVTREWKKNRITHTPPGTEVPGGTTQVGRLHYQGPDENLDFLVGQPGLWDNSLPPNQLDHWADWYNSNHPTRQGTDIMSLKAPDMHQRIQDWEQQMKEESGGAAANKGDVVHQYPDGWTMQNLNNEKALVAEGDAMGHCVGGGGYWPQVDNGHALIYSLRDEKNEPHATMEMTPRQDECPNCHRVQTSPNRRGQGYTADPCVDCGHVGETVPSPQGSEMVQIQGKGNEAPKEEYQQRIKDYFSNFGHATRPRWADQDIHDADDFLDDNGYRTYHPGDYGLEEPDIDYDWDNIVKDHADTIRGYPGQYHHDPHDIAKKAMENGYYGDLKGAVEDWGQKAEQEYRQQRWDDWVNDPEGEAEDYGHDPIETYGMEPDLYDDEFYDAEGDHDQEAFDKAHTAWEEERDHKLAELRDEAIEHQWWDSDENQMIHDWADALYANRPGGRSAATELPCEVCGDPLEGGKCKRCDWGGWSDAMGTENPMDPTRDMKPAIQS